MHVSSLAFDTGLWASDPASAVCFLASHPLEYISLDFQDQKIDALKSYPGNRIDYAEKGI